MSFQKPQSLPHQQKRRSLQATGRNPVNRVPLKRPLSSSAGATSAWVLAYQGGLVFGLTGPAGRSRSVCPEDLSSVCGGGGSWWRRFGKLWEGSRAGTLRAHRPALPGRSRRARDAEAVCPDTPGAGPKGAQEHRWPLAAPPAATATPTPEHGRRLPRGPVGRAPTRSAGHSGSSDPGPLTTGEGPPHALAARY